MKKLMILFTFIFVLAACEDTDVTEIANTAGSASSAELGNIPTDYLGTWSRQCFDAGNGEFISIAVSLVEANLGFDYNGQIITSVHSDSSCGTTDFTISQQFNVDFSGDTINGLDLASMKLSAVEVTAVTAAGETDLNSCFGGSSPGLNEVHVVQSACTIAGLGDLPAYNEDLTLEVLFSAPVAGMIYNESDLSDVKPFVGGALENTFFEDTPSSTEGTFSALP